MCFNGGCELGTGIQVPGSGEIFDILGIGSGVRMGASRTGPCGRPAWGGWIDGWPGWQGLDQGAGWPGTFANGR